MCDCKLVTSAFYYNASNNKSGATENHCRARIKLMFCWAVFCNAEALFLTLCPGSDFAKINAKSICYHFRGP